MLGRLRESCAACYSTHTLIVTRYGIHLAKVDLKTGTVLSNWTNLWNGTGGIVSKTIVTRSCQLC